MRRTYRSKKDTEGALDARDVVLNLDEKTSVFDAFYIQNIKQTKRELSCVAPSHHVATSNKVRKRKYVRRIVKEVEPVRQTDSLSHSAYLTPDKSIRVNKVLDPFDLLLNSSPVNNELAKTNTEELLQPNKESKTYVRKRKPKIKKYNYSSSDNEPDKENTRDSNVTNIKAHELLIEKAPDECSKTVDDSIQKIVHNLPLFHSIKNRVPNKSFNTSYKNRNKLTKNFQSPMLQKSPLCSTPFKEKYRGVSIFKFSPITQNELSVQMSDLDEKDNSNHSIILVSKSIVPKRSHESKKSPLTQVPIVINNVSNSLTRKASESPRVTSEDKVQSQIDLIDILQQNDESIINNASSSLQVTEAEPFLGFSNNEAEASLEDKQSMFKDGIKLDKSKSEIFDSICKNISSCEDSLEIGPDVVNNNTNILINTVNQSNTDNSLLKDVESCDDEPGNSTKTSIDSIKCKTSDSCVSSDDESFYDTCDSDQSSITEKYQAKKIPVVAIERMNDSIFFKYYNKRLIENQDKEMDEHNENDDFESLANSSNNEEQIDVSMSPDLKNIELKYNPIIVTDSSTTEDAISNEEDNSEDDIKDNNYVSFVTTRRRNDHTKDSMFMFNQSYGSNSTDCDKTVLSNSKTILEISDRDTYLESMAENDANAINIDTVKSSEDKINKNTIAKRSTKESCILSEKNENDASKVIDDLKSHCSEDIPSKGIATRKISRVSRQSNFSSIDESKTLCKSQSNKRVTRMSTRSTKPSYSMSSESDNEKTLLDTNIIRDAVSSDNLENQPNDIENTSTKPKESLDITQSERFSLNGLEKPSIVLQPGKKWERSLSIYKRMTMADHLDHSILDVSLQNKGRKYRQSVIVTMEMQECKDSLHNDSVNSRRSTFVSNPSRPAIRFVKDPNFSRVSLNTSSVFDDLKGFLSEECDDTVIELSKLSIADSEHEVTVLDNFHESERVTTARDFVLRKCNQVEPILFDECYPETVLKNCHKIGEGVYGEVFLWRGRDGRARVMKIVPIAGTVKVNGEPQKDFHEIISEIVIAMELSALRAPIADIERQLDEGNEIHALDLHAVENATDIFNEVLAVRCVNGPYPSRLLDLWELYDECKGSENDNPASLPADQRYIVLELANAGQDLESYQFSSAQQAHALFQQIAFGLAVAEEAFQFEHRDLHWGNVLIAPTDQKLATFVLRGRTYRVPRRGVAATVIDYSLSRLSLPLTACGECAALYNDLTTDDQLFDAVGDYQFHVYRLMRDKLGNDWKNFEPYTNILWLHYIVDKMITALRYKRTNTKIHKHYIEKLTAVKDSILEYGSAVQYVLTDIDF